MRTNEYADRHHLYKWVLDSLDLPHNTMHDFSRLNFVNTVLSKRKLGWLVDNKYVEAWNDPRFPTLRGIFRRGMTKEALVKFILEQGHSKNTVLQEWDKLWAYNKQVIDPIVPRYSAIVSPFTVKIEGLAYDKASKMVSKHPKNESVGNKYVIFSNTISVEAEDFSDVNVDEKITLME